MLALIIRGIFLVGILGLYSTSVWKMIDGYFKDRFQNYLQEEFRKNPRMREDLNAHERNSRKGIDIADSGKSTPAPGEQERRLGEAPESGPSPVDVLATVASFLESADLTMAAAAVVVEEARENRVRASVDNGAFRESLEMQSLRKEKRPKATSGSHGFQEQQSSARRRRERIKRARGKAGEQQREEERGNKPREKRSILESESNAVRSKKRKFKTITFTEDDFKFAKRSVEDDDDDDGDFSEFDHDSEVTVEKAREGILVAELPFKPRFDIGDLEVVTADEFCPLTLDDEATCGIPSKWP